VEDTEFVGVFLFSFLDVLLIGGGSLHPLDAGFFTTEFQEDTELIGVFMPTGCIPHPSG